MNAPSTQMDELLKDAIEDTVRLGTPFTTRRVEKRHVKKYPDGAMHRVIYTMHDGPILAETEVIRVEDRSKLSPAQLAKKYGTELMIYNEDGKLMYEDVRFFK